MQSQYYSEIDDITPNPSYTPMRQETSEYEVEMVSSELIFTASENILYAAVKVWKFAILSYRTDNYYS